MPKCFACVDEAFEYSLSEGGWGEWIGRGEWGGWGRWGGWGGEWGRWGRWGGWGGWGGCCACDACNVNAGC